MNYFGKGVKLLSKCTSHSGPIKCQWGKLRLAFFEIRNNLFSLSHIGEEVLIVLLNPMAHFFPANDLVIDCNEAHQSHIFCKLADVVCVLYMCSQECMDSLSHLPCQLWFLVVYGPFYCSGSVRLLLEFRVVLVSVE